MPTSEELRRIAEEAEEEAREAQRARDHRAEALLRRIAMLAREVLEERRRLQGREQVGSVEGDMFTAPTHALATSYGRAKASGNRLAKAAAKAGYNLEQLGEKVGRSKAALSASQRKPRKGGKKDTSSRPIAASVAKAIEALIGYEATDTNYPAGIIPGK